MDTDFRIDFLDHCAALAFHDSITLDPNSNANNKKARVVTLDFLTSCLIERSTYDYINVIQQFSTTENFFRTVGREMMRSGALQRWQSWNYEIMTVSTYYDDKRYQHRYFSKLTEQLSNDTLLFVFYKKEDKRRFEHERALLKKKPKKTDHESFNKHSNLIADPASREILELCQSYSPTELFFTQANTLVKRLQKLIDQVWPDMNYKVVIFGSAANRLGLQDADIDLCIVVPHAQYEKDLKKYRNRLAKIPNSVYNMTYLAKQLRNYGMKDVEAITTATVPICKFYDPRTDLHCDINTHNILGIENTNLIGIYADLDFRIRPFLSAIKYFVKQKDINNPRGGTLSSYAYVIMALHFLMAGLENPLIPSLQNLNVRCENKSCNSRAFNKIIPVFYNNHIIHCDVRYHDCVCIRQRSYPLKKQNNDVTLWEGNNKDTVAELVTKFFLFYSDAVNYVVSIITDDGKPVGNIDMNFWPERPIIVQDPFILTKNVARTCTSVGFSIILEEFRRAAKLLMKHVSFATVCDKQLNLPRFIDTQCLDYRIQIRKQKKMIAKEMRKQHKEIRLQQKQPPQQETKLTTPTTTKDHVIGYLDDDDDNSKEEQLIKWLAPYLSDNNEIEENNNNNTKTIRSKESAEIVKSVLDEFTEALFTGEYYEEEEEVSDEVEEIKNMDHKEISILPTYFPLQFPNLDDDDKEEEEDSDLDSNDTENSNRDTELRPLFFNNEDQQISSSGTAETPTSSSTSKMITNDTTDNMDSKPILNLVKKLISYQPPSTSADDINGHSLKQLTTVPCTDMQKLLDDPCMSDIDMKDICYLVAQLNFLSDAVTHRLLNRKEKEAEAKQKTGSEIGRSNLALKNLDNTLYQMQNTTSKRPSSEKLVDVFFTVENVPAAFDAYIIYTEFYWYGQVLDVSPAETRTENSTTGSLTTKWNVHMKLTYENYKIGSIPRTIQYNADCIDDCFYVSEPVLLSPSV